MAIILLVAGLVVGGGIGYFAAPRQATTSTPTTTGLPLKGATVKLGYIASDTTALETGKPHHEQIITPDLNAWAKAIGWGGVQFVYLSDDAQGQSNTHLEKVQGYKSEGITILEGGGWSSEAQSSLSYVNSNDMLMWSTSSTSPTLAIANDRLYRMCPADSALAPALVDVMWSYGIKSVIIFQRGDSWGDGIVNLFVPAWTAKGGEQSGATIRYAAEATDFSNYLQQANTAAAAANKKYPGGERVALLLLSFNEAPVIVTQMKDYPDVYATRPFGGDGTALSQRLMDDAPEQSNHLKIFSLQAQAPSSSKFNSLKARYEALTKQQYNAYTAYAYDVGFLVANTIYQAQSSAADDVVSLQTPTAYMSYGAGGWEQLNEFGDRAPPPFDVWFYAPGGAAQNNKPSFSYVAGTYNTDTKTMVWNTGVLGYTPKGP